MTATAVSSGAITVVSATPYTILTTDRTVHVDPSVNAAQVNVTLPAASAYGKRHTLTIKKRDTTFGSPVTTARILWPVRITPAGSDTIDGAAGRQYLSIPWDVLNLKSDGVSNWSTV